MSVPSYRLHKPTGQAVVRLTIEGKKKDFYLGKYGSPESRKKYEQVIADYLSQKPVRKPRKVGSKSTELTVSHLCLAYFRHAESYYVKNGKPTDELAGIRAALKALREDYGSTLAKDFGPLCLESLQSKLDACGRMSRGYINQNIGRIVRMFRWAASKQLINGEVYRDLQTVTGLQKGRCKSYDKPPVKPVSSDVVDATLPHLAPVIADMVRIQLLCGMRPMEVCLLRPDDIDRSDDVWVFTPEGHKMEHRDKSRLVVIGPQAQAILTKYLFSGDKPCFRSSRSPNGFNSSSYRKRIHNACEAAGIDKWNPNQLRHSAGTKIRADYGLEAASVILGHSKVDTTQVYAERDFSRACQIAREVG